MKHCLVLGAGGFIGNHLVSHLCAQGCWVRGVDLKTPEFSNSAADEYLTFDLRRNDLVAESFDYCPNGNGFDEVYQLAADMGGAGYIFSGENDANIMHNSALINLNVCENALKFNAKKVFYSSSACIYPAHNQMDPSNPNCEESSAYPANPDSGYGWEKLFSERLYLSFHKNHGLDIRIARFHNIFGPKCAWNNGKEKAPAAICRKVAEAKEGGTIEIWGDGEQTRSFLYIDECLEGVSKLMNSSFIGPVNIGSSEMITINDLVDSVCRIAKKKLKKKYIKGQIGVRGRNSDNTLIKQKLGWAPELPLKYGLEKTYKWVSKQLHL